MTLADVSNASQAIAGGAVVVSLIILILQNHQANLLARAEATRRQIEGLQNISRMLLEAPGLAELWTRASRVFRQMTGSGSSPG